VAVQAATVKKLERLIKGVPTSKLRKRPASDKWSVAEILAHLADAEIVGGFRIRLILGAPGTPIAAFDQDSWVTSGHYAKRDPRKSVEQFRVVREANLALLKSLTPESQSDAELLRSVGCNGRIVVNPAPPNNTSAIVGALRHPQL
jgi:DinB superfamily